MDFEGLHDLEPVLDYYNGGYGGGAMFGSGDKAGPGPNYGITFSDNALALISALHGGVGQFSGNPSGVTVALFAPYPDSVYDRDGITMDMLNGWQGEIDFSYTANVGAPTTVFVYSGTDLTGELLNPGGTKLNSGDGSGTKWDSISIQYSGTAHSIYFDSSVGVDNLALVSIYSPSLLAYGLSLPSPVPESSTAAIWSAMLFLGAVYSARKRRS